MKKPIYKKWWFWVIVVLVIGVAAGSAGNAKSNSTGTKPSGTTQAAAKADVGTAPDISEPADKGNAVPDTSDGEQTPEEEPTAEPEPEPEAEPEPTPTPEPAAPVEPEATMGEKNALASAKTYLSIMAFSYTGLIEQLEFEGYTAGEATYAADNCGADWNEQAALSAKQYLNTMSFSRQGLIDQLVFEGFTQEQAEYGVAQNGY